MTALGLKQLRAIDAPELADGAVDGRDQCLRVARERPRIRAQGAREELVEAPVRERIRLYCVAHLRLESAHEIANQPVLDCRRATARERVDEARQEVLR